RKCTVDVCELARASASVTSGLFGRCGPQCPRISAAASATANGSRSEGTVPPVMAPAQATYDMLEQRSPMKNVLLTPSVKLECFKHWFSRKAPSFVAALLLTPLLPLTAT